jgi:hypothetical protein
MSAHLKRHSINDTADHDPGTNGTLLGTESGAIAEKSFGPSASANLITQRDAAGQLNVPTPTATGHAASKGYVDQKVAEGITWKEIVLVAQQFENGGSGGINQAILAAISVNLAAGDTVILTDGTTTETFTATAGAPAAFQFQVGGSASATTDNLVAAINADSTLWDAVASTDLDSYFSPSQAKQFVVYRQTPSAANDRVYGTIAGGQDDVRVIAFNTGFDYSPASGVESDLPNADPGAKRFGIGRLFAALQHGETHRVAADSSAYFWDGDDQLWQTFGGSATVTAGDGIDVTAGKVSTDVAVAAVAQQYGAVVDTRTADGTGTAAADAGFLAVQTDNSDLNVNASNQLAVKAQSRLDRLRANGSWSSTSAGDRTPTLAELNAALGTGASDIGNWTFMVEGGPSTGSNATFLAFKKANAGVLADYHLVEMSA